MLLKTTLPVAALSLAFGSAALAHDHAGMMGYALAEDGGTLVTMADISKPGEVETHALETPLRAIAYRPVTGQLLGFADGMIYEVDPGSGELTDLGADPAFEEERKALHTALRTLVDPAHADSVAKARQADLLAAHGGREAVIARGDLGFSPPPGVKADFR